MPQKSFDFTLERTPIDNEYDIIIVKNTPSIASALELSYTDWFNDEVLGSNSLVAVVVFKIIEKIEDNARLTMEPLISNVQKAILITLESTVSDYSSHMFWKTSEGENFYDLLVSSKETMILTEYCRAFLANEVKCRQTGE